MQQQKQQLGALWPRCHSDWEQVTRLLDAALNFDEAMKKCYQHCPVWGEQLDNVLGHVYEQRCCVEMVGHVMYAGGAEGADTDRTVATAYREHQRVHNCPQGGFQPEGKRELHPMCNCAIVCHQRQHLQSQGKSPWKLNLTDLDYAALNPALSDPW